MIDSLLTALIGSPPQSGSCLKEEVPGAKGYVCAFYRCPFIPWTQRTASPDVATPLFPLTVDPTVEPFVLFTIPELLIAYNFSNPLGPQKEVYVNLGMTNTTQSRGIQRMRLTRAGHDVVSYLMDIREEISRRFMASFWGLIKAVRSTPFEHDFGYLKLRRIRIAFSTFGRSADPTM